VSRQGPGAIPEAVLRGLDLGARRRLQGLVPGEQPTPAVGAGVELASLRPYRPGDDVRQIDWNATARTREPHVRVHVAERTTTTWLVLDLSPSMVWGTADRLKLDVAEGVATAVGRLATRRGNRLGVVTFGGERPQVLPPRQGRAGLLGAVRAVRDDETPDGAGTGTLAEALGRVGAIARSRGLVVVVSDLRGPRDWRRPLQRLTGRHGALVCEVGDPRESELPDVGDLALVDPETGRQLRVDTGSRGLRERFAAAAAAERAQVAHEIRGCGAEHVVLSTRGDWLRVLAGFLGRPAR